MALMGGISPLAVEAFKSWLERKKQQENHGILVPNGYKTLKLPITTWQWILICTLAGGAIGYGLGWQVTKISTYQGLSFTPTSSTDSSENQTTIEGDNSGSVIQSGGNIVITNNFEAPSPTSLPPDWQPIQIYTQRPGCIGYNHVLLPDNFVPSTSELISNADIDNYVSKHQDSEWLVASNSGNISYLLTIASKGEVEDWIRVDGSVRINVKVLNHSMNTNNVNIGTAFLGCGGVDFRNFPNTSLISKAESYSLIQKSLDADAYSLEPGEFEDFLFDFKCESPGIYQVNFGIPYTYKNETKIFYVDASSQFICPSSYTVWTSTLYGILRDTYSWDGIVYQKDYSIRIGTSYLNTSGNGDKLREKPLLNANIITKVDLPIWFLIIDGPVEADGQTWWKVEIDDGNIFQGWIAETADWSEYYRLSN